MEHKIFNGLDDDSLSVERHGSHIVVDVIDWPNDSVASVLLAPDTARQIAAELIRLADEVSK